MLSRHHNAVHHLAQNDSLLCVERVEEAREAVYSLLLLHLLTVCDIFVQSSHLFRHVGREDEVRLSHDGLS